jgi:hypothetical protein
MTISRHLDKFVFLNNIGLNQQLAAHSNGTLYTGTNRLNWETWGVELADPSGCVFLRNDHNRWLGVSAQGELVQSVNRTVNEQWRVESDPSGNVLITSAFNGKRLSATSNTVVTVSTSAGPAEQWRIEEASAVLKFDGQGSHVVLPPMNPDFSQGLTIEAWVRHESFANYSRVLDMGNGPASDNIVLANSGTSADFGFHVFQGANIRSINAPGALTTGVWQHIAATLDASGYGRLYKNGVQIAEGQMQLPRALQRERNYIGKSNWPDAFLNGRVAELRLWTYARSVEQLAGAMGRRLHGDESGLCGYWRLDGVAGLIAHDLSSNNRHAAIVGEASWLPARFAERPFAAPADEIKVSNFDGNGRIRLPAMDLDFSAGCTVEAWVYPRAAVGWARVLTLQTTRGIDHVLLLCNGPGNGFGLVGVTNQGGESGVYSAAGTLQTGRWTHICGVIDPAGEVRLYKDGQLIASGPALLPRSGLRTNSLIGSESAGYGFPGMLAELRLWTGVRSEAQIRDNMSRGLTGHEAGLKAYWKLDEDSGASARDHSTNNYAGTRDGGCAQVVSQLPIEARRSRVTTVTHEGKVLVFATRPDGRVQYTVKQSGFEDTVPITQGAVPGWELWKDLVLPDQPDDASVTALEARTLNYDGEAGKYYMRSRYRTASDTAIAAVQVVSGFGFLYVFRQSSIGTLLVDRFVLDGLKNELVPKVEVRFKRSRQRYTPLLPAGPQAPDQNFDSLDFSDTSGAPFYEPSTELCSIRGVHDGLFAVVLLPTKDPDRQRWHVFLHNSNLNKVVTFSILSSETGLFDLHQRTSSIDGSPIPGVERSVFDFGATLTGTVRSLCGVRYDLQEEQASATGQKLLLRTAVRVMLVVEADQGANVLSFAAAADGTLSRLVDDPQVQRVVHSERRELLLPLDTLENVQAAKVTPPVAGAIATLRRGSGDKVAVQSNNADKLKIGDSIEIKETQSYNGRYAVNAVTSDTFEIDVSFTNGENMGKWEKVSSRETGLTFDGAVTSYRRTADNKLLVTAPNHGLVQGDAVQVTGTSDYNGIYPVSPIDAGQFALDAPWVLGSALGVKQLAARRRRGIVLNGLNEYVAVRNASVPTGNASYTVEAWIRPGSMAAGGIVSWGADGTTNQVNTFSLTPTGLIHHWANNDLSVATVALTDGWHHVAASHDAVTNTRRIYLDGAEIKADNPSGTHAVPTSVTNFTIGRAGGAHFPGAIADVRVWSLVRTREQLASAMFDQLTGQEDGLCGFWKLGAIAEGDATAWGLAFDGVNDCAQINDTAALRLGTYTVEVWIKPEQPTQDWVAIVGKPGRNFNIWLHRNGSIRHNFHTTGGPNDGPNDVPASTIRWGEWNHIAITNDGQTARTFHNGVERASIALAGKTLVTDNTPLIIGRSLDNTNDYYFKGVMDELRLWSTARSAAAIAADRGRHLVGNEAGLVGYWRFGEESGAGLVDATSARLDALVTGGATAVASDAPIAINAPPRSARVFDFSPRRSDGVVVGAPYVANVVLTNVPGAQYRNDDLVAVVRGGIYEESVELRANDGSAPVFKFSHWFKKSSDSVVPDVSLTPIAAKVSDIGGGWYRASCQFAVPATTSLMRAFKIVEVAGAWTTLELRRHRLVELPDAITEWEYAPAPKLNPLTNVPADLDVQLAALGAGEQIEAALLVEKRVLEDKIAASLDPTLATRITQLQAAIAALETERARLNAVRAEHLRYPMIFCCRYTPRHSGMALAVEGASQAGGARVCQVSYHGTDNELFYADPGIDAQGHLTIAPYNYRAPEGHFLIRPRHSGMVADIEGGSEDNCARLIQWSFTGNDNQWFRFQPVGGASNTYTIMVRHSQKVLDVRGATADENEGIIQFDPNGDPNQQFALQVVRESPITQPILNALNDCQATIASRTAELNLLILAQSSSQSQRDAWQARLTAIINVDLPPVRQRIASVTTTTLGAMINDAGKTPVLGLLVKEQKRGLSTLGGLLTFVRSTGRITALQTCDGDVQLNYVDVRGRMREVRYQATRDSRGATIEGWRPTAARAGLGFLEPADLVRLDRPLDLGDDWSVEACFQYPLPKTGFCNTLVFRSGVGEVSVYQNRLGVWLGDFYDCGFDVNVLSPGWHHLAVVARGSGATSTIAFFVDGKLVGDLRSTAIMRANGDKTRLDALKNVVMKGSAIITALGNHPAGGKQFGRLAELRLWGIALKDEEVAANSRSLLTGREPGLLAYFPMTEAQGAVLRDASGNDNHGTITNAAWVPFDPPLGRQPGELRGEAMAVAEYDTIGVTPGGTTMALMRRAAAVETPRGVRLLAEQRVEALDLRWVGNAQFQPTLLGYIEGPPPVPSENLTLNASYNGAASVELSTSDDVTFQWNRAKDDKFGSTTDFFMGFDQQVKLEQGVPGILGFSSDVNKLKLGAKLSGGGTTGSTHSSTIGAQSSLKMTDRLELRGTLEEQPRFPQLGSRFIPKSVGYALVVSGLADVFITSLKRSGRMVGYEVVPNNDIEPDVNTVSFLINPAYTMAGSLDGLTGSKPTSDRFFAHVPELRAQYGSRYPASYYRLKEAYDLKQQIAEQDRSREAYFFNFDARIKTLGPVGDDDLAREIDKGAAPTSVSVQRQEDRAPAGTGATTATTDAAIATAEDQQQDYNDMLAKRRAQIEQSFADREQLYTATRGLDRWQERMEDLRIRAGKRNIVNTYVWDANGGLHTEQQQFASSVQHSVGSNASVTFNLGGVFNYFGAGFGFELTSMANIQASQTLTKTVSTSRGFGLGVSLAGVESRGVTDHKDRPMVPGEKVGRYRFMSFYLEGATQHFNDFFSYVVDPEWLIGNSENARALRETRGRTNKAWRVLHRVTYVERPALANFGADLRPLPSAPAAPSLDKRVESLEAKLDLALKLLQAPKTP